jgi:hypothetical protein
MKEIKTPLNKIFLESFIDPHLISNERLTDIFDSIKSYEESHDISKFELFHELNENLSKYISDIEATNSEFAKRCLGDIFNTASQVIHSEFNQDDSIKPAIVKLIHPNRKYPFHKPDNKINLKFQLINEGIGYAFNLKIEVVDCEDLKVDNSNIIIYSKIEVESISIELPVSTISNKKSYNPSLLVQWSWQNYDKSYKSESEIFTFESQKEDIDWEEIRNKRPYSLQSVEKEEELVGRKDLVANIHSSLISETIESAMIFGQKRVGKTSIAKILNNKLKKNSNYIPIFIKVGDLNKNSPEKFIKTLGDAIVEEILDHPEINKFNLTNPDFTDGLSPPLANFFKKIKKKEPEIRFVIIIDEFDEIPSELYRYTDIGNTFFHNIRSLSQEGTQIGFILIGGENMQIIRQSTDRLNLFSPFRVDYFDREKLFEDFKELIKHPVQNILEFSDDSINFLYVSCPMGSYSLKELPTIQSTGYP